MIGDGRGVEARPAVAVWAAALPDATLTPFRLDASRTETGLVVGGMPKNAGADEVGLLLADPYTFPIQGFVEQSADVLGGLPLVGGLASGPGGAGGTRLFLDGVVHERGVVGVTIGGDVRVRTLVSQGCRPIGPTMTVTAAEGPHLQGLAGTPAYAKLEEIVRGLDEADQQMVGRGLHLGIAMDEYADDHRQGDFLIRGVVGADPEQGSITVGDVVEVGRTVRFQVRDATSADADLDWLMTPLPRRGHDGRRAAVLVQRAGTGDVPGRRPRRRRGAPRPRAPRASPGSSPPARSGPSPPATTCTRSPRRCSPSGTDGGDTGGRCDAAAGLSYRGRARHHPPGGPRAPDEPRVPAGRAPPGGRRVPPEGPEPLRGRDGACPTGRRRPRRPGWTPTAPTS